MISHSDWITLNIKQGWMAAFVVRKVRIFSDLVMADKQIIYWETPLVYWPGHSRHRKRPHGCALACVYDINIKHPMTVMSAMTKPYLKPFGFKNV
jgi:hypothetical protein